MTGIGLIGVGSWGSNWLRTLASLPEVQLRWCCDQFEPALTRVRQQWPGVRTSTDPGELFADPALEGVVLATSAPTHFDLASRALRAGKHVMVEKPMTLQTGDAVELVRLARLHHRVLMVGHLLEYHPATAYLKSLIDSGELGEVYYLYSQRLNHGKVRSDENAWWSLAPHDVSVALRLLGEWPVSVQCCGQNIVQQTVADVVFATLEFPAGRLAHIHVSWLDPHKSRKLTVIGSRRMVTFEDARADCKVTVYDKSFRLTGKPPSAADWVTLHSGDVVTPKLDTTEPLVREARHFVECVGKQARPTSDGESGARVVSVLEYGQRSLETGAKVMLPHLDEVQRRAG